MTDLQMFQSQLMVLVRQKEQNEQAEREEDSKPMAEELFEIALDDLCTGYQITKNPPTATERGIF